MKLSIKVEDLRQMMQEALEYRKVDKRVADFMVEDYIEAELSNQSSHGLSKFLLLDASLKTKEGPIVIEKEKGNYAKVNGRKNLGHYAGLYCTDKAVELAKQYGNSIVTLSNASRYSRVKPFARRIAENGYIGIVLNNGGPAAVAPYGSSTPIFGTNPICFSFPSRQNGAYTFDFSTSKKVWAEIRQAMLEKRPLPEGCFYDKEGKETTDPDMAEAVKAFGGPKGFALCYAIEILTGAFVGCKMGQKVEDEYDLGFLFIALSPDMFGDIETFKNEVDELADEVRTANSLSDRDKVYIPGERTDSILENNRKQNILYVDEEIINRIKTMRTSLDGGLESNNKIN